MAFDYLSLLSDADVVEIRRAGEIIFEMGQPGRVMYVIKSGTAQIRVGDMVFETVGKGVTIGEMAILEHAARSATALAVTDCEIVAIDEKRLLEMVRREPLVAIEMTRSMVRRLKAMNYLAQYDTLTELPNRTLFRERCRGALARAARQNEAVAVLCIDLDHFENVNDSLGYAAGNQLLGAVAARLAKVLPRDEALARLGADEFAILVETNNAAADLAALGEDILNVLAEPFDVAGTTLYVSASVGISCSPGDGSDEETLLNSADTAMHQAKSAGRNKCAFFSSDLNAKALEVLTLKTDLRKALDRDELYLCYQPRVDLASGRIAGVEALIRWRHPELGIVSPARFIPIAEEGGLIVAVGNWVLRTGCRQHKAWLDAGLPHFRMAINLSAHQLRQADLVETVSTILAETGLPAAWLELEITESALMHDPAAVAATLKAFRDMGIAVALDDFGTGYSSLSYLKRFPLDYMKIDQSFVRGIPDDADDVAITRTIVALAENLALKVVVEGIETAAQLAFAQAEGCDEFQGYLFSKPLPAAEVEVLLRSNLSDRRK